MDRKTLWTVFAIGGAAGAIAALFFSPKTASKTRKLLREGLGVAEGYFGEASGAISSGAGELGQEAQTAISKARSYAHSVIDSAGDLAEAVARSAKSLV